MPGTLIRERSARIARSLPTNTGVFFLVGLADKGPQGTAVLCRSLAEFVRYFGNRVTYSLAYDMIEAFFAEGGSQVYFSRILGPAPVTATANLLDAGAGISLVAKASSPGEWGNALNVAIVAGDAAGEFKVVVTHDTDTAINLTSPSFVDQQAAATWFETNDYVRLTLGASALDPAIVAATSLATGADDRTNASDATRLAALNAFPKDLGPGQVAFAGYTTSTAHGQLADHAYASNRVALYDPPDTTSKATLLTTASTVRGLNHGRNGGLFAPWVNIPATTALGARRAIPPSAVVAGLIARNDANGVSPNKPSGGDLGVLKYVDSLRATFSKADSDEMNEASANIILEKPAGDIKVYGYRSGTSKTTNPNWWQFGNVRLYMRIAALADAILERFVLREVDGRGLVYKELEGQLVGMLLPFWEVGSLHGEEPDDAFAVDTGSDVNTTATKEAGEIHAVIELTMSPMAETVILDIVKTQITG